MRLVPIYGVWIQVRSPKMARERKTEINSRGRWVGIIKQKSER